MNAFTDCVKRKLLLLLVLHVFASLSISVTYDHNVRNIVAKTRIPLQPLNIPCYLSDMVRIAAPFINEQDQYFLSKPNGDTMELDLNWSKETNLKKTRYHTYRDKSITVKYVKNSNAIINHRDTFYVFTISQFEDQLADLDRNEFIIGPLIEEDYGNWVLSVYTKDLDDEWIELFQVITVEITTMTLLEPAQPILNVGDTLNLSFAHSLPQIESCEITAPSTVYDRFFTRSSIDFNKCGFSIPNITLEDAGFWKITGIGRIMYEGEAALEVIDPTMMKGRVKSIMSSLSPAKNQSYEYDSYY